MIPENVDGRVKSGRDAALVLRPPLRRSCHQRDVAQRARPSGRPQAESAEMTARPSAPAAITSRGVAGIDAGDADSGVSASSTKST